ncbi:MAG: hypothetical protein QG596_539 [Actinomycetota bacterium]|jgi:hypothetical protein|nr:hypothetical protein [Actinomycetota bacterium]
MNVEPTTFLVIAVVIVTAIGAVYGMKTRKGSGINEHPGPDSGDPSRGPDFDDASVTEEDRPDSTLLDQHGKQ